MTDQKTIAELIEIVREEMRKLEYSERSLQTYEKTWKSFKNYASERGVKLYTTEVGLAFLEQKCQFITNYPVKYTMEEKVRAVNRLDEYYKYHIISTKRPLRRKYTFPEEFRDLVQSYIVFKKAEGISESRIKAISLYMERFINHLYNLGLRKIIELDVSHIHSFVEASSNYTVSTLKNTFTCLRGFFAFIHESGHVDKNYSFIVPSIRLSRECTIPSAYSEEEVEKILNCIDRSNIKGKRDYAMLLLASRLGLRASDICGLMFTNLNWERNSIEIVQKKTKKAVQLPLLNEVGDAIIDYLRFRPKIPLQHVFLRVETPPNKLHSHSLYEIVSLYIKRSGIHVPQGKKHGPHALRHSLSSLMLENRVPLPVISEILSHSSSDTTKVYLKIDILQLRECALPVPVIKRHSVEVKSL
jgi:site-specific recombinase XerD